MNAITDAMRRDPVVSEVYRAKSEELGPGTFRFVAEIGFSGARGGGAVSRSGGRGEARTAARDVHGSGERGTEEWGDPRAMDAALKMYGEEVVTAVGDEVDRIEKAIVRAEPSIHYVDLETN